METKSVSFQTKDVDVKSRTVVGYASTWDADLGGDRMIPGCFKKTAEERGPKLGPDGKIHSRIKIGYNHWEVIGLPLKMTEDEVGLYTEYRVDDTQSGVDVLKRIESGTIDSMSFSYDVIQKDYNPETGERLLKEVKVYEFGPVDYPMNEMAMILGMKSLQGQLKQLDPEFLHSLRELKVGRVLSSANLAKVQAAVEALTALLEAAGKDTDEEKSASVPPSMESLAGPLDKWLASLG